MTLQVLVQSIKEEYKLKSIARTRYAALDKVIEFLSNLTILCHSSSAIEILKEVDKKEFKLKYSKYKTTQLNLSQTLSGAENQAINDLYKQINTTIPSITLLHKQKNVVAYEDSYKKNSKSENTDSDSKTGLLPMMGKDPKILILGTMPGDVSLKQKAYYRNESRNKFWEILHSVFADDEDVSYEDLLKKHHIALWDCLKAGKRQGSTDEKFETDSLVPNDLENFLSNNPSIKTIILNGKGESSKSTYGIFNRFFPNLSNRYRVIALSSSSNANATITLEQKIKEWSIVRNLE